MRAKNAKIFILPLITIISVLFALYRSNKVEFEADILKVLEQKLSDSDLDLANGSYEQKFKRNVIILLSSDDYKLSQRLASELSQALDESHLFEKVAFKVPTNLTKDIFDYFINSQRFLLSKKQLNKIKAGESDSFFNSAIKQIYSPFGTGASLAGKDPLFLFEKFVLETKPPLRIELKDGYTIIENRPSFIIVNAKLKAGSEAKTLALLNKLEDLYKKKNAQLFWSSLAYFNLYAKSEAIKEATYLSLLSVVFVVFVFWYMLKSLRYLPIGLLHILSSIALSFIINSFIFKQIHLVSLLLSISVVGVIADHIIHFFIKEASQDIDSVELVFRKIRRPLILSTATTLIGFFVFIISSNKVLEQFGYLGFCTILSSIFLLSIGTKYYFRPKAIQANERIKKIEKLFFNKNIKNPNIKILCLLILGFLGWGIISLVNRPTNIKDLHQLKGKLVDFEQYIRSEIGSDYSFEYFIAKGKTLEDLLQNEELLTSNLDKLAIKYSSITKWVPSVRMQLISKENFNSLIPQISKIYKNIGYGELEVQTFLNKINSREVILFDSLPKSILENVLNNSYLGVINKNFYSIVHIFRKESSDLTYLNSENYKFYNKLLLTNQNIRELERTLSKSFFGIILLMIFIFLFKYSIFETMKILVPAFFSSTWAMTLAGIIFDFNIFSVMGGILVFFIGIDYSFFHFFSNSEDKTTSQGIFLCTLTTLSSFVFLGLSENKGVSSFGLVVSSGIILVYLSSLLSRKN